MVKHVLPVIFSQSFYQRSKYKFWKLLVASLILSFVILNTVILSIYAQPADSPWPMYQHDPQRTGRSEHIGPQTNEVKWTFSIPEGEYIKGGPAVGQNGVIYLLSTKHLLAISDQGELKWKYPLSTSPLRLKTPLIGPDGTIYIGTITEILAISPSGNLKWETEIKPPLSPSSSAVSPCLVFKENVLYFVDVFKLNDHYRPLLTAFDADTGNLLWVFDLYQEQKYLSFEDENIPQTSLAAPPSILAVGQDGNIYIGFQQSLLVINAQGNLQWKKTFDVEIASDNNIKGICIGDDGTIYLIVKNTYHWSGMTWEGYGDSLYALSPTGEKKWERRAHWILYPFLIGPGETIYFTVKHWAFDYWKQNIYALDLQGNIKWTISKGGYSLGLVDTEGNIYGEYGYFQILALNSQGDEIWSYSGGPPNYFSSLLALSSNGTLYALSGNNLLAFAAPGTGNISGTVTNSSTGDPISGATISVNGYSTTTDSNGDYSLSLPEGIYSATASADGYESQTEDNVTVIAGNTTTVNFTLVPIENQPPTVSFTYSPENPIVGEKVTFDASSSNDPDGQIELYEWDWNSDGTYDESTTSSTVTHSWNNKGTYQVGLRVTDNDGATDTTSKEITIYPATTGSISGIISYSGTHTGNIRISAFNSPSFSPSLITSGSPVAETTISTPGPYSITGLPEGSYYLIARLPGGYIGHLGVYSHNPPYGSPALVSVTAGKDTSSINITVRDEGSISGTLSYTGAQTGDIYVEASLNSSLSDPQFLVSYSGSPHSYSVQFPSILTWYVFAFIDSNGNGKYDSTEPFGKYGAPDPVTVEPNTDTPNINITFKVVASAGPDLDITSNPLEFLDKISPPFSPNVLKNKVVVTNRGTVTAQEPVVRFFLNDTRIGLKNLDPIEPGEQAEVTIEWAASSNIEDATLQARVEPIGQEDTNPSNNIINQSFSFYFVDFRHNRDAFSFQNPHYSSWDDCKKELRNFLTLHGLQARRPTLIGAILLEAIWGRVGAPYGMPLSGHCYGMATSSLSYYLWPELKPVDKPTFRMRKEEVMPDIIARHWTQFLHIVRFILRRIEEGIPYDAISEYNKILNSIKNSKPILLSLSKEGGTIGHADVAYKILDLGDNEKRVYVYENNHPYDDPMDNFHLEIPENCKNKDYYVTFNLASKEASYTLKFKQRETWETWNFNRVSPLEISQWVGLKEIEAMIEDILSSGLRRLKNKFHMLFRIRSPVTSLVTDEAGRRIGYINGSFVNEIPGADMINQFDTQLFYLPSNLTYTIKMTGTRTGNLGLDLVIPTGDTQARVAVFEDIPVNEGSKAMMVLNSTEPTYEVVLDTGEVIQPENAGELDVSSIFPPSTSPTGTIVINNGNAYTNSRNVTLTLSAENATQMCFSNDNSSWSDWESYTTEKSWTLTSGDGTKTVYVKFKGNGGVSRAYSDTIILDTTPPKVVITSPESNIYIGGVINIIGIATDTHFRKYKLYYGKGENPATWNLIKESSSSINNNNLGGWDTTKLSDGTYTIKLWADDKANNSAETKNKVFVDNTPPEIKNLTLDQENFISGDYASSTPTILATLTDTGSGVDKETIDLRIKPKEGDEIRVPASSISFNSKTGKMSYTVTEPLADSKYEVSLGVKDKVGNSAEEKTTEFVVESKLMMMKVLNYPNPFSSGTKFTYILTRNVDEVTIKVYTVAGELIKTIDFASSHVGYNQEEWDGINDYGEELANGTYPYKITVKLGDEKISKVQMLTVLK